jgi:hypothetical protein
MDSSRVAPGAQYNAHALVVPNVEPACPVATQGSMPGYGVQTLPESFGDLTSLHTLDLRNCLRLVSLPLSFGKLASLHRLDLSGCERLASLPLSFGKLASLQSVNLSNCERLASLPPSLGQLAALQALHLCNCTSLVALPESVGHLACISVLDLAGCDSLEYLPYSMADQESLQDLTLPTPLRTRFLPASLSPKMDEAPAVEQVDKIIERQRQLRDALANNQRNLQGTLERMSWVAILLATATFIGFLQPPGGYADGGHQVRSSGMTSCTVKHSAANAYADAGGLKQGQCGMFLFFIFDTLSFSFSLGCVVFIVTLSIPRTSYKDSELETGGIWLRLAFVWMLLYVAVATGFGAFAAGARAVYAEFGVMIGALVPGILLLLLGLWIILHRLYCLFPGRRSVWRATKHMVWCCGADAERKPTGNDVEMCELLTSDEFWQKAHDAMEIGRVPHMPHVAPTVQACDAASGSTEITPLLHRARH